MKEPYEFYVEYYGRMITGYEIKENDFFYFEDDPSGSGGKEKKEYDIRIKIAISLAGEHVKTPYKLAGEHAKTPYNMYSKSAFEKELEHRLS